MFCPACGKRLSDGAAFCGGCGTKIDSGRATEAQQSSVSDGAPAPASVADTSSTASTVTAQAQPTVSPVSSGVRTASAPAFETYGQEIPEAERVQPPHEYRKLGGVLLFIVVSDYIAAGAMVLLGIMEVVGVASVSSMVSSYSSKASGMLMLYAILAAALYVVGAVLVWIFASKIRSKDSGFLNYYLILTVCCIVGYFIIECLTANIGAAFVGALILAIYEIPWIAYFLKSVRVRTYMGSDEYLRKCSFTSGVRGPAPAVPDWVRKNDAEAEGGAHVEAKTGSAGSPSSECNVTAAPIVSPDRKTQAAVAAPNGISDEKASVASPVPTAASTPDKPQFIKAARYCVNCDAELFDGDVFCAECGAKV